MGINCNGIGSMAYIIVNAVHVCEAPYLVAYSTVQIARSRELSGDDRWFVAKTLFVE